MPNLIENTTFKVIQQLMAAGHLSVEDRVIYVSRATEMYMRVVKAQVKFHREMDRLVDIAR